ncbi:DUF3127 domain-containing protein [Flavobacterium sp. ZS1P14]|uniref:DUF3127 domain-containing protein n=1 Tax=Flavobacterium sp. ZS1P14 TaxID=3401729 RepID=UPI003AAA85AF
MTLTATLIQLLPFQSGESKNGTWRKQDVIVETDSQYPKKICVSIWGDKINESQLQVGNSLIISCELESREFNSKWYTDVKALKIEIAETKVPIAENSFFIDNLDSIPEEDEDLPF